MAKIQHPAFDSMFNGDGLAERHVKSGSDTAQEYVNALTGKYEFTPHIKGELLAQSRHNNEKNNSKAIDHLVRAIKEADLERYEFQDHSNNLANIAVNHKISDSDFNKILEHAKGNKTLAEGVVSSPYLKGGKLSSFIKDHPNLIQNVLQNSNNIEPRHVTRVIHSINTGKKAPKVLNQLISKHLDKLTPEQMNGILTDEGNYRHLSQQSIDSMLDRMNPDNRKRFIDDHLGITGGNIHDEDSEPWDNWSHGEKHSRHLESKLASSKHLDPAQIDHIKRHGDSESKLNLFYNPHTPIDVVNEMHQKYLNDDEHHGYDLSDLKEKLGEDIDRSYVYDNYGDEIREKAEEAYPMSQYIEDNVSDEDFMDGQTKEDYIDSQLEGHDWTSNQPNLEGEYDDLSDNKEEHPEYESRRQAAEDQYDQELTDAKDNVWDNDNIRDRYNDSLSENESEHAREKLDEIKDNVHENEDFYPQHLQGRLSSVEAIKAQQALRLRNESWDKAKNQTKENNAYLKNFMPNGYNETYQHGEGQHHLELAKKYADANGGAIDIGTLNKKHPNMVEKWKGVFAGGKGKLRSEEIQAKIDELPKTQYNLSYIPWNSGKMQNINKQDQVVVRLDHSPESIKQLEADPEAFNVFKKINEVSQRSGHPTNMNTIGWARVDMTNPKHWMIDEVQRDHDSSARNYLKQNGKESDAAALDKVMDFHKNWREQLFNSVQKLAEKNGVEKISTHSPESKAAHTGASKVHTVYNDSYSKVPKQLGFKLDLTENLPLSEEGKEVFSKVQNKSDNLLERHKQAMKHHAVMWKTHEILGREAYNEEAPDKSEAHHDLKDQHSKKFRLHQAAAQNIDPTDEVKAWQTPDRYIKANEIADDHPIIINNEGQARTAVSAVMKKPDDVDLPDIFTAHPDDAALTEKPKTAEAHMGHTMDIRPEAFKKNVFELLNLMKAEGFEDSNMKIIQVVQFMDENKEALESLKQSNPEAYQAIQQIMQSLLEVFKETRGESVQATAQQLQLQDELHSQMGQDSPEESPEAQDVNFAGRVKRDEKPHGHRTTYAEGMQRDHADGQRREKEPSGEWKVITSAIAQPKE